MLSPLFSLLLLALFSLANVYAKGMMSGLHSSKGSKDPKSSATLCDAFVGTWASTSPICYAVNGVDEVEFEICGEVMMTIRELELDQSACSLARTSVSGLGICARTLSVGALCRSLESHR